MGGTKIFTVRMKDLIRVGIIVLLGVVLVVLALVFLIPRGQEEPAPNYSPARYIPGTYVSTIILNDVPVHVRVTVSENDILSVYMTDMADVQRVFFPLFEPRMYDLAQEILRYQSAHITPQTDYPVTTGILHRAVKAALEMAHADE